MDALPDYFSLIFNCEFDTIQGHLDASKTCPTEIQDSKQSSLLHLATLCNSATAVQFFLDYLRTSKPEESELLIDKWVQC